MKEPFGHLPDGSLANLYTIQAGDVIAKLTDYGAALVSLVIPDKNGKTSDVVLGFDCVEDYCAQTAYIGATVGRNANRIGGSSFVLNGKTYHLTPNEKSNNLHSGPSGYNSRLWQVTSHTDTSITFRLDSPSGDQGFPGNARIQVCYSVDTEGGLTISYEASADQDTVFNLTNHSYFNLAGQQHPNAALSQTLSMPGRHFCPDDAQNIPTGALVSVEGTPMDFRQPKPIGRDIHADYEPLKLQGGYDHNWEAFGSPCAILREETSGRTMSVSTDMPGIQFYAGNFLDCTGKGGIHYGKNAGIALETQFYPDALHHPEWKQPVTKAGEVYRSKTVYRFDW